jgi:aryl-alcohol dehydrogenase-like predicted oxidoreductase
VRAVAERHGATPAQVALAWVLAQGDHVVPIPGTKRLERLEENVAAADLRLSAEDLEELDALPGAVGSRY